MYLNTIKIIEELMKLDLFGKYSVMFDYSTTHHWLTIGIFKGPITQTKKPIFLNSIMIKRGLWYNDFRTAPFDPKPFVEYLRQLRVARHPILDFDPIKPTHDDPAVL